MYKNVEIDSTSKEKLWHYTDQKGFDGIINNNNKIVFRAKLSELFSDHYEGKFFVKIFRKNLNALYKKKQISKDFYAMLKRIEPSKKWLFFQEHQEKPIISEYDAYVICFCMKDDNPKMWHKYAKKGYCLNVNRTFLLKISCEHKEWKCLQKKVIYTYLETKEILSQIIVKAFMIYKTFPNESDSIKGFFSCYLGLNSLLFKRKRFGYENEYRFIILKPKKDEGLSKDLNIEKKDYINIESDTNTFFIPRIIISQSNPKSVLEIKENLQRINFLTDIEKAKL